MKKTFLVLLAVIIFASPASAFTIYMDGVNYPGDIKAEANFTYDSSLAQVFITMSNTSLIESLLTGFAFNAADGVEGASLVAAPDGWKIIYDEDGINSPGQFGLFDIGALTGNNLNGGNPNSGIVQGDMEDFIIGISGTDLNLLTEVSFLSQFSLLDNGNGEPQYFITRFQGVGFGSEGSDVAIPGTPAPIPEPSTIILLSAGLIGLTFTLRRKKHSRE